ncbi:MAG: hypothetical protein IKT43_05090, partial [Clostridia bacterium]|nr:hypothetical protein [Clostridia bacterium]
MTNTALRGKPDAGNPHVRFDEGEVASAATPRRGSLLYKAKIIAIALCAAALAANASGVCKLCGRKGTCFEKHGRWYCATLKKGGGPGGPVQA